MPPGDTKRTIAKVDAAAIRNRFTTTPDGACGNAIVAGPRYIEEPPELQFARGKLRPRIKDAQGDDAGAGAQRVARHRVRLRIYDAMNSTLPAVSLALIVGISATPQDAAKLAQYVLKHGTITVIRTNIAFPYAAVLTRGGLMEGSPVRAPILVGHFSFGWQALEILNLRCRLNSHDIPESDREALMRGLPRPVDDRPCGSIGKDAGPASDVAAIRLQMHGPLVPWVVISGNVAMGT